MLINCYPFFLVPHSRSISSKFTLALRIYLHFNCSIWNPTENFSTIHHSMPSHHSLLTHQPASIQRSTLKLIEIKPLYLFHCNFFLFIHIYSAFFSLYIPLSFCLFIYLIYHRVFSILNAVF